MRSPPTCLRCRGRKWRMKPVIMPSPCWHCGGSGCRHNETIPAEFLNLQPHPRLVSGPSVRGEIDDAK